MNSAVGSSFIYVTDIRATAERVWSALISPEFSRQYWLGAHVKADWKIGGLWQLVFSDGQIADVGEVLEFEPAKRLAIRCGTSLNRSTKPKAGRFALWKSNRRGRQLNSP